MQYKNYLILSFSLSIASCSSYNLSDNVSVNRFCNAYATQLSNSSPKTYKDHWVLYSSCVKGYYSGEKFNGEKIVVSYINSDVASAKIKAAFMAGAKFNNKN